MNPNKTTARYFGVFFLCGYAAYIAGNVLVGNATNTPSNLANIVASRTHVIAGAIFMGIVEAFFNIGMAVIIFPTVKRFNKIAAYGYLSAAIASTVMLTIGAVSLLLLVPVSDEFVKAGANAPAYFQTLSLLCIKGNYFAYQIGMAIWGLGGLLLCYLLYISALVPRPIAVWGFIGYVIFAAGTIFELYGIPIGVYLDIPGGLFELFLSGWCIVRGFNITALNATALNVAE